MTIYVWQRGAKWHSDWSVKPHTEIVDPAEARIVPAVCHRAHYMVWGKCSWCKRRMQVQLEDRFQEHQCSRECFFRECDYYRRRRQRILKKYSAWPLKFQEDHPDWMRYAKPDFGWPLARAKNIDYMLRSRLFLPNAKESYLEREGAVYSGITEMERRGTFGNWFFHLRAIAPRVKRSIPSMFHCKNCNKEIISRYHDDGGGLEFSLFLGRGRVKGVSRLELLALKFCSIGCYQAVWERQEKKRIRAENRQRQKERKQWEKQRQEIRTARQSLKAFRQFLRDERQKSMAPRAASQSPRAESKQDTILRTS